MTRKTRAKYSPEFKREAVRLLEQGDKDPVQLARELDVARNKLYQWKEEVDSHGTTLTDFSLSLKVVNNQKVGCKLILIIICRRQINFSCHTNYE